MPPSPCPPPPRPTSLELARQLLTQLRLEKQPMHLIDKAHVIVELLKPRTKLKK
jgi:hypothetical protein